VPACAALLFPGYLFSAPSGDDDALSVVEQADEPIILARRV